MKSYVHAELFPLPGGWYEEQVLNTPLLQREHTLHYSFTSLSRPLHYTNLLHFSFLLPFLFVPLYLCVLISLPLEDL